jgi:hypothetical protein
VRDCCACLVFHQGSCGGPQGFLSFSKKERFALFFRVVYGILVIVGKVCSFLILYGILVLVVKRRKKHRLCLLYKG